MMMNRAASTTSVGLSLIVPCRDDLWITRPLKPLRCPDILRAILRLKQAEGIA